MSIWVRHPEQSEGILFYESKAQFLFSATLAQTFNKRCSALTGAAITVLALAEPFIAAGAAVGFLVLFSYRKRTKPPRL
jgi:hypothetical protein